jgi:hypothetical protein
MKINCLSFIILTILFISILHTSVIASDVDSIKSTKGISICYWGNVLNTNGIQVGYEKYVLQTNKHKVICSSSINFQRRNGVYSSAGFSFASALRRTFKCGLFLEHGIKIGYLGSYYDFDFYKLNSDDEIVSIGRKWINSIVFGYMFGFGYDFSKYSKFDMQLLVKPHLYYRIPNNDNVLYFNNIGLEAGLIFHPKWLK